MLRFIAHKKAKIFSENLLSIIICHSFVMNINLKFKINTVNVINE
jgi:hypothetical protein